MALTLAEASKLSNDILLQGIVETVVKDSPVLRSLPFVEIVGNGLTYNRENALPSIDFYDVGDNWDESTPTFDQRTANLKIMGGDADVDNFLKSTRSNIQDLEAAVIEMKSKALKNKFEETFIYGDSGASAKQFDGLRKLIDTGSAGNQVIAAGAGGATLTLGMLDQLIDAVRGGRPDMLLMSRRSRRKVNTLVRAGGGMMETDRDKWGNFIELWNGIPLGVSDWVLDTHAVSGGLETSATSGNCSSIYAIQLGEGALCGPDCPRLYHRGTGGLARDQGRHADQDQMVRLAGAVLGGQGCRADRGAGLRKHSAFSRQEEAGRTPALPRPHF